MFAHRQHLFSLAMMPLSYHALPAVSLMMRRDALHRSNRLMLIAQKIAWLEVKTSEHYSSARSMPHPAISKALSQW
jgi:hypothetical protein